jgi:hypothetical protein
LPFCRYSHHDAEARLAGRARSAGGSLRSLRESAAPDETTAPSSTTSVPTTTPDLAVFIAAVNEAAADTSYQDAALSDPEVFVGIGQLFCERVGEGQTVDAVLTEYLTALEDGSSGTVTQDDAHITGAVMGASLEILCPEHREAAT